MRGTACTSFPLRLRYELRPSAVLRYGRERLQAASGLDFFAKFGTRQSPAMQKARAHYLLGLGYLGKGQRAEAKTEFEAALRENVAHLGAKTMLAEMP
jgi:hypothetical protein